ncbi:hypothetical protein CONCODRAFT_77504 [Conidiobolus coronatus NRRL 28638]|uniref:Uncharacterized protein n=1 Tax=Conidiobolus coronatus (strain ATCC 28846 / CBS 209.66 / NRRL 28638) TaxID=796925 RepID=A0A137PDN9_CONC2|nr:hypothetical protein CONCODRAFT_77504 [Conidiobolus coronatus NRRL 28638]|eukprot:KXN73051.1 hypothetical protein CONCODRAFT_77504 [Conidiobolus coronatus NRRL 28638]
MLLSSEPVRKPSHPAPQRLHRPVHHIKSKSLNQSQVQSQSIQYLTLPKNIMRSNTATVNETHLEPIDHVKSLNHLTLEQLQNSRR